MDYGAVLTAALHTQAYSDHWGTRCDVFDIPGMDRRAYLRPSSDATLAFVVVPADTLTLARVFYRRTKAVAGVRQFARDPQWRVEQELPLRLHVDRLRLDDWRHRCRPLPRPVDRGDRDSRRRRASGLGPILRLARTADRHAGGPTRVRSSLHEQRASDGNAASRDPDRAALAAERGGGSASTWRFVPQVRVPTIRSPNSSVADLPIQVRGEALVRNRRPT